MNESFNIYEFVSTMKNITPEEIWDMLFPAVSSWLLYVSANLLTA